MVLQTMGESLIELEEHITTIFTSGSKITAVVCNTFIDGKSKAKCQRLNAEEEARPEVEVLEVTYAAEEAAADNTKMMKNAMEKAAAEVAEAKSEAAAAVAAAKEEEA